MSNEKAKEISLGEDFGAAAITLNGLRLEVGVDGKSVKIVADFPVEISYAVNENTPKTATAIAAAQKALEIGDTAKDGYIYAGDSTDSTSPRYKEALWVAPKDAGFMTWNEAAECAASLRKRECNDKIGLPTRIELNQMFNVLAKKDMGGFDRSGSSPVGWYWAAEHGTGHAACQRFSGGGQDFTNRYVRSSVRFVR